MSRALTEAELAAIEGLSAGKLQPLLDLLAAEGIHPSILWRIRKMIDGAASECDWRISVKRHPDLQRGQSDAERSAQIEAEFTTALAMVRNGALCEGGYASAVNDTAKELGIGEGTVKTHWGNRKQHIINDLRFGLLDPSILPGPIAKRYDPTLDAVVEIAQVSPPDGGAETL